VVAFRGGSRRLMALGNKYRGQQTGLNLNVFIALLPDPIVKGLLLQGALLMRNQIFWLDPGNQETLHVTVYSTNINLKPK
jgi:hypothetical protein